MKGHEFADFLISHKFPALIDKHFYPFFFHRSNPNQVTFVSCTSIRPIPLHFKARGTSMDRCLEHQSPQFAVDSQFESFAALKHACTRAALLDVYEFVPDKVTTDRYTLKCKDKECAWYLYATAFPGTDVWRIRKTIQAHSCHGIHHSGHCNVDEEFISTEILPKLRSDLKFAPKAIQNHLKEQCGVTITYSKAWRAKERPLKVINGSHEEAYNSLPKYCHEIQRSNPGSTVQLDIDPKTNRFKRLFICFAASAMGFAYCRPLLGLDGTHLTHMYQGTIFI